MALRGPINTRHAASLTFLTLSFHAGTVLTDYKGLCALLTHSNRLKNNKTVNADTTNMMWLDTQWHNIHLKNQGRATGTMAQRIKGPSKPCYPSLIPRTHPVQERTDPHTLSSDLPMPYAIHTK